MVKNVVSKSLQFPTEASNFDPRNVQSSIIVASSLEDLQVIF